MGLFVQIALVINQYVNPLGFEYLTPNWKLYVIYTCWIAFELVFIYFFYVETKGPTLEEISQVFDGPATSWLDKGDVEVGEKPPNTIEVERIEN